MKKTKEEILASLKEALAHKKEWQERFKETYASEDMKVEYF